jgi:hypothetical protein
MERYNILRNHVKFYNNVQVAATYTIPISLLGIAGSIETLVYSAISEVISQNPIMGVSLADEGTSEPKWVRLPTIDLDEVVRVVEANPRSNIDRIIHDGHRAPFDRVGELPLWRVLVISTTPTDEDIFSFALAFVCHHAAGDGLSAAAFHLTFLDTLNIILSSNPTTITPNTIIVVPALPLNPTLEMKATYPLSFMFTLKQIINAFIYSFVDPLVWTGPLIDRDIPRPPVCNNRSFTIPFHVVCKLVAQCREEKTTLTALVTVLVARKLAVMYPSHTRFVGAVPFSLRKFTGHGPRDMGVYVSQVLTSFSAEPHTPKGYISCRTTSSSTDLIDWQLWESARACKAIIDEKSSTTTDQTVALLKFVKSDFPKFFMGMLGGKRGHAFEVSNIGMVDGGAKTERQAYFDQLMFSQGHCTFAPPHIFNLASAKGGAMTVVTTWETGVVDDDLAGELLEWLEGELQSLGAAGEDKV